MQDIPTKSTGDSLTAAEFNQIPDELENAILSTGQTLSGADLFQLAKAVADYSSSGDAYTDTGAADAYALGVIGSKQGITAYTIGTRVRFIAGNTNTGASTVNVNGLGLKNIKNIIGGDPAAGSLVAGQFVTLEYDGTDFIQNVTGITLSTSVTLSGVSIDFAIPAAAKRVNILLDGASTDGVSLQQVQLGDTGGIEITGYNSTSTTDGATASSTTGILLTQSANAANETKGKLSIDLLDPATFQFVASGVTTGTGGALGASSSIGGGKTLTAELTTVRITTVNGTDSYDGGSANVSWEF